MRRGERPRGLTFIRKKNNVIRLQKGSVPGLNLNPGNVFERCRTRSHVSHGVEWPILVTNAPTNAHTQPVNCATTAFTACLMMIQIEVFLSETTVTVTLKKKLWELSFNLSTDPIDQWLMEKK